MPSSRESWGSPHPHLPRLEGSLGSFTPSPHPAQLHPNPPNSYKALLSHRCPTLSCMLTDDPGEADRLITLTSHRRRTEQVPRDHGTRLRPRDSLKAKVKSRLSSPQVASEEEALATTQGQRQRILTRTQLECLWSVLKATPASSHRQPFPPQTMV